MINFCCLLYSLRSYGDNFWTTLCTVNSRLSLVWICDGLLKDSLELLKSDARKLYANDRIGRGAYNILSNIVVMRLPYKYLPNLMFISSGLVVCLFALKDYFGLLFTE